MNCADFRKRLLDGRTDADHAAACAPCWRFAAKLAAVDAGLAASSRDSAPLPPALRAGILAATTRESAAPRSAAPARGRVLDSRAAFAFRGAAAAAVAAAAWLALPEDLALALPAPAPELRERFVSAAPQASIEVPWPLTRAAVDGVAIRGVPTLSAGPVTVPGDLPDAALGVCAAAALAAAAAGAALARRSRRTPRTEARP